MSSQNVWSCLQNETRVRLLSFQVAAGCNKIGHAYSKINAGNPTDSLETRSMKVLYKNSLLSPEI